MALVLNDRVKETTTTTGTGTLNLAGAATNFETFVAGIGDGNTVYYAIVHQSAAEFEVGLGTVTDATPDTLSRTTILSSSNSDSAVNFSSGTKDVFCTLPASKTVFEDASSNVTLPGTITAVGTSVFTNLDISGDVDVDGTLEADAMTLDGTAITTTATLSTGISNNNVPKFTSGVVDDDFLRVNGTAIEGRSASEVLSDIGASAAAGSSSIVTTGALDSGSITSGFGTINNGSSTITTTGAITGGSLVADNITIDGTEIDLSSGSLTVDVADDITLDADGGTIIFKDGGTEIGFFALDNSGFFDMLSSVSDADIRIRGNDGGSTITALTFDMSDAGAATFNNDVTAFSDARLKDNIETLENGLQKIEQLRGVTYTRDNKESIGVIAQEVEKILPEIVKTADDEMGTKSVDYSRITAVLIEAVKELSAKVQELESK
ncbi:MAG: tail fiber domain-containing protein [Trichodesmium sp. MAG_R04]|nr:tail fiber domain-containing protein [Trichodesmium sp. MAG_R04]